MPDLKICNECKEGILEDRGFDPECYICIEAMKLSKQLEADLNSFKETNSHLDTDRYKNLSPDEIIWAKSIGQ